MMTDQEFKEFKKKEEICACGDSKGFHTKKSGCKATWKMGTESCDCTKFELKHL